MSKKKSKKSRSYFAYEYGGKKKDTKKSKKKDSYYEKPTFKRVKPTLDKKDAKESKKILLAPVDIPKEFRKNRDKCNHAGDLLSTAEFKEMTPNYGAYTPMLDTMIKVFGANNVDVCKCCYDVTVNPECLSVDKIKEAVAILYAAANVVVSRKRMKNEEIKDIAEVKNNLKDWNDVIDEYIKLEDRGAFDTSDKNETTLNEDEMKKISRGNAAFTI